MQRRGSPVRAARGSGPCWKALQPADLAAKGLKLAQKLVGTATSDRARGVRLDEGTQPGAGGLGGRRQRQGATGCFSAVRHQHRGGVEALCRLPPSAYILQWCQDLWFDDMDEGIVLSTGNVCTGSATTKTNPVLTEVSLGATRKQAMSR